jgi:hypothetical protein
MVRTEMGEEAKTELATVAALFVQKNGPYFGVPGVDPWDRSRNAMSYAGPNPVIAHPPCARWCRLAGLVQKRWGHKKGDDGGLFEFALGAVRRWGGVLEHPAYTDAFLFYGLPPPAAEGWQKVMCGGWVAHVEQGRYGHVAKKATWLYSYGCAELPSLKWGLNPDGASSALVSWCGNHVKSGEIRKRVGKYQASKTPVEFRDMLISIARSSKIL